MSRRRLIQALDDKLPSGYLRVMYLEKNGNQGISNICILSGQDIVDIQVLFDEMIEENTDIDSIVVGYPGAFEFGYSNGRVFTWSYAEGIDNLKTLVYNKIYQLKARFKKDTTSTSNLNLFYYKYPYQYAFFGKVYDFKIFSSSYELKNHFVPCLDNNRKPCMYDMINKTTHYNSFPETEFGYETLDGIYVAPV